MEEEMERNTRGLWVFVIVVLVFMGLCALAITAVALGALTLPSLDLGVSAPGQDRIERSFAVGASPSLTIKNFSGGVTVRAGEEGTIRVVAVKKGLSKSWRDQITIDMTPEESGLVIETKKPSGLSIASVDLEITAPPDTRLNLQTGSGGVEVDGLTKDLSVDTGSGGIDLRNVPGAIQASTGSGGIVVQAGGGPARLDTGSGGIEYEGTPQGDCRFETGSGGIELRLPATLNVQVDLGTGSGSIDVEYEVTGQRSGHSVKGTIGTGDQGAIYAHTGSGSIDLKKQ
jgi:DUF4097 and DUF4098 domain-containing protein YvlB